MGKLYWVKLAQGVYEATMEKDAARVARFVIHGVDYWISREGLVELEPSPPAGAIAQANGRFYHNERDQWIDLADGSCWAWVDMCEMSFRKGKGPPVVYLRQDTSRAEP